MVFTTKVASLPLLAAIAAYAYSNLFLILDNVGVRITPPLNNKYAIHKAVNNTRCWKNPAKVLAGV